MCPTAATAGEVLAKVSGTDYDTDWVPASAPGVHASTHAAGSTDPVTVDQSQVTGLVVGSGRQTTIRRRPDRHRRPRPGIDAVIQRKVGMWVASTPTEYKTDLTLTKSDVGLGNVDNTSRRLQTGLHGDRRRRSTPEGRPVAERSHRPPRSSTGGRATCGRRNLGAPTGGGGGIPGHGGGGDVRAPELGGIVPASVAAPPTSCVPTAPGPNHPVSPASPTR